MNIRYIPLSKAPELYGLSLSTLYRAARVGRIEIRKVGRRSLVVVESIERFMDSAAPLYPTPSPSGRSR